MSTVKEQQAIAHLRSHGATIRLANGQKTDRLDVSKVLTMLLCHAAGERKVGSGARVPSVADEDGRPLPRELLTAKRDRTRVSKRMQGLLAGDGIRLTLQGDGSLFHREGQFVCHTSEKKRLQG